MRALAMLSCRMPAPGAGVAPAQRLKAASLSLLPKERLQRILNLAMPVIAGMVSQNVLNLVDTAMVSRLEKLDVKSPIESLLPLFDARHVAIVMDGEKFLGLITRIDLLNYLRRRVQ